MTEYIKKEDAINVVMGMYCACSDETEWTLGEVSKGISNIEPSSVVAREAFNFLLRENDELRKNRPTATGVWINDDGCMTFCSECYGMGCGSRYCPNCGAKMENYEDGSE